MVGMLCIVVTVCMTGCGMYRWMRGAVHGQSVLEQYNDIRIQGDPVHEMLVVLCAFSVRHMRSEPERPEAGGDVDEAVVVVG